MTTRDDYVEKMKQQIDQWNGEVAKWEAKAKDVQADMRGEYEKNLETLRSRREEGLYQLKLLQGASADAWTDMMRGTEEAWKSMSEAFAKAASHFEKK